MTTTLQVPTVAPITENKHIKRLDRECRELEDKLTKAAAHLSGLVIERDQFEQRERQAAVAHYLDGGTVGYASDPAQLTHLDAAIATATADEAAIRSALDVQRVISTGVRAQREQERHAEIKAAIRTTLAAMHSQVTTLIETNLQLLRLAEQAPGALVPIPGLLLVWAEQAGNLLKERA